MPKKNALGRVFLRLYVSAAGKTPRRKGAETQDNSTVRRLRFAQTTLAIILPCLTVNVSAGGYQNINASGIPFRWSTATPITLNYDIGPFSATVSKATADAFTSAAINQWANTNLPTCALSFTKGADLSEDHGDGLGTDPNYNESFPDGITPIIYDQNGLITSSLFAGAETVVIGFGSPKWSVGTTIIEGQAVLNGRFLDSASNPTDISQTQMQGVATHEFGHMLNLAHSQCNDAFANAKPSTHTPNYSGYPTMYPIVHSDIATLELDDKVWMSSLYPSTAFASTTGITGFTRDLSNSLINGVNIVARSATVPTDAITCVSGIQRRHTRLYPRWRLSHPRTFRRQPLGSRFRADSRRIHRRLARWTR